MKEPTNERTKERKSNAKWPTGRQPTNKQTEQNQRKQRSCRLCELTRRFNFLSSGLPFRFFLIMNFCFLVKCIWQREASSHPAPFFFPDFDCGLKENEKRDETSVQREEQNQKKKTKKLGWEKLGKVAGGYAPTTPREQQQQQPSKERERERKRKKNRRR